MGKFAHFRGYEGDTYSEGTLVEVDITSTEGGSAESLLRLSLGSEATPSSGQSRSMRLVSAAELLDGSYWFLVYKQGGFRGNSEFYYGVIYSKDGNLLSTEVYKDQDSSDPWLNNSFFMFDARQTATHYFPYKDGVVFAVASEPYGDGHVVLYHSPDGVYVLGEVTENNIHSGDCRPPIMYNTGLGLITTVRALDNAGGVEVVHFDDADAELLENKDLSSLNDVSSITGALAFQLALPIGESPKFLFIGPRERTVTGIQYSGYEENGVIKCVSEGSSGDRIAFGISGGESPSVLYAYSVSDGFLRGVSGDVLPKVYFNDDKTIVSINVADGSESTFYSYSEDFCYSPVPTKNGELVLTTSGENPNGWAIRDVVSESGFTRLGGWDGGVDPNVSGYTFPDGYVVEYMYAFDAFLSSDGSATVMSNAEVDYAGNNNYSSRSYAVSYEPDGTVVDLTSVFDDLPYFTFSAPQVFILTQYGPPPATPPFWANTFRTVERIGG